MKCPGEYSQAVPDAALNLNSLLLQGIAMSARVLVSLPPLPVSCTTMRVLWHGAGCHTCLMILQGAKATICMPTDAMKIKYGLKA